MYRRHWGMNSPLPGMYRTTYGMYKYAGLGGALGDLLLKGTKTIWKGSYKMGKDIIAGRGSQLLSGKMSFGSLATLPLDVMFLPTLVHNLAYPIKGPMGFAKESLGDLAGALTGRVRF